MGIILSFGKTHRPMGFGIAVRVVEFAQRKYGETCYKSGVRQVGKTNPTVQKIYDWIDVESENYIGNQDIKLECLSTQELLLFYKFLCDFRVEGTTINGMSYDHPLSKEDNEDLDDAIFATRLYIEARENGLEKQKLI